MGHFEKKGGQLHLEMESHKDSKVPPNLSITVILVRTLSMDSIFNEMVTF